jgi:hypothetical protein
MLRLALSYEQIADSVEQCIRRLADNAGENLSSLLVAADSGRGSHRSRRLSSLTSAKQNVGMQDWMADELGKAPLKKTDEEGAHGWAQGKFASNGLVGIIAALSAGRVIKMS